MTMFSDDSGCSDSGFQRCLIILCHRHPHNYRNFTQSSVSHQRLCNQVLDQFLEFNRKGSIADREVRLQFFGCRDQAQVLRTYGSIGPKRKMTMESVHFPLLPGALGI